MAGNLKHSTSDQGYNQRLYKELPHPSPTIAREPGSQNLRKFWRPHVASCSVGSMEIAICIEAR